MALLPAYKHIAQVSATKQSGAGLQAFTHDWPIMGPVGTPLETMQAVDNDEDETGRESLIGETADTVVAKSGTFSRNFKARNDVGFWMFGASHNGNAATKSNIGATAFRLHWWEGGITDCSDLAFSYAEIGDPDNTSNNVNKKYHNVSVESFNLSGARGGMWNCSVGLRYGGNVEGYGAPGTSTRYGQNPFVFSRDTYLHSSSTSGYGSSPTAAGWGSAAPTTAAMLLDSSLAGSPVGTYLPLLTACDLTITKSINVDMSHEADGFVYIENCGQYVVENQEAVLTLTFEQNDAAILSLLSEHTAGTTRPWELMLGNADQFGAGGWPMLGFTCGSMKPVQGTVDVESASSINGPKTVTLVYKALWTTGDDRAWYGGFTSTYDGTALGG